MRDLIRARAARFKRIRQKEALLREDLRSFAQDLTQEFDGLAARGRSDPVRIEAPSTSPPVRASLVFDNDALWVLTEQIGRSSIDQSETYFFGTMQTVDGCSAEWLEQLFAEPIVTSLINNIGIGEDVDAVELQLDNTLAAVRSVLSDVSVMIDAEMSTSLVTLNDESLPRLWRDAIDATHSDSADALTRCSRFLEAVCAKILRERNVALPKDKSMSPLVKACLETLTWPAEKEAAGDVRQLLGGIQSITNGISALRTHFGTAHGATSHLPPLDRGYAVFVKQATVAAATFLLDRHQASPLAADDSSPAPVG